MKEYTIPVTTRHETRISTADAVALAIRLICETCGVSQDSFVENGNLCQDVEVRTSHSSWRTGVIRPATETDKAALHIIALLRSRP